VGLIQPVVITQPQRGSVCEGTEAAFPRREGVRPLSLYLCRGMHAKA